MEKFKHRIKFYLIGFAIGIIFMFLIFGNRGCSWLPGNRVKNMIAEKEIYVGDSILDLMNCANISNQIVYDLLNENGEVEFDRSNTKSSPKVYFFTGDHLNQVLEMEFILFDSTVEIKNFNYPSKLNCQTNLSNQHKQILPIPDAEVVQIIESNELRILNKAKCQIECLQLNENEVLQFHKSATFDAYKSRPRLSSNPEYVMTGTLNGKKIFITYIIGDKRSRIADISPNTCSCDN